jgi:hypothetical protein
VVSCELEKTRGEHFTTLAQVKSRLVEDHMMAGAFHAHAHAQLGTAGSEFFQAQPVKVVERSV